MTALRARLRAGERLTGALVRMPAEELVEMLAVAGHDFVLIDCEHGPADVLALRTHLALADAHGLPVLVRPGEGEHRLAQRALDQGAAGVVAPHVESAADARALVAALHHPPRGTRGFATYSRAGRFGAVTAAEHHAAAAENTVVIAMLESVAAIRAAGAIVGVPGVDGYLVGPSDLAASRAPDDPSVADLLADLHDDMATAGAVRGDMATAGAVRGDPSTAGTVRVDLAAGADAGAAAFADGAQVVVYNLTAVLMDVLRALRH